VRRPFGVADRTRPPRVPKRLLHLLHIGPSIAGTLHHRHYLSPREPALDVSESEGERLLDLARDSDRVRVRVNLREIAMRTGVEIRGLGHKAAAQPIERRLGVQRLGAVHDQVELATGKIEHGHRDELSMPR
jgi:hypothetical protein